MTHDQTPLRKSSGKANLVESYCSACGMFIAASRSLEYLEITEKLHRCPSLQSFERGLSYLPGRGTLDDPYPLSIPHWPVAPRGDKVDRLLHELDKKESLLDGWLRSSEENRRWFRKDPVAAIRAANLGLDEDILKELESLTSTIAYKLKAML